MVNGREKRDVSWDFQRVIRKLSNYWKRCKNASLCHLLVLPHSQLRIAPLQRQAQHY